ncbi:hypothetical protein L3Q82_005200 [Scortum barcoo]|uniref:Uncharacterized protein n=1 Tax=Scortum barcoo TaxID=214431 RepID=A0ACB8VD96_9TELE|nr:hypothetical protein L3Q82_005200 [Scortum barcoo]
MRRISVSEQSCPRDGGSEVTAPSLAPSLCLSPAASPLQRPITTSVRRESGVAGGQDGAGGVAPLVGEGQHTQPFRCLDRPQEPGLYTGGEAAELSRQARWALFFSRFDFVLTYRHPGSCNIKPDALSRQFSVEEKVQEEENILPTSRVIAAITPGT